MAPTSTAAERPGGAGPGSSKVAGLSRATATESVGVSGGGGEGCVTGQIPAEQRGVKDERGQSVGMKLTPCWWREKARWGSSWRRKKRHRNAEGNL